MPDLLFVGTEFGLYFTPDGGETWIKLSGGVPTISFRDLEIQRRENDLVGATFGRGFYVLDDYSAAARDRRRRPRRRRHAVPRPGRLVVRTRRADRRPASRPWVATTSRRPNPPFGAVFTYFLDEETKTGRELRREEENGSARRARTFRSPAGTSCAEEALEAPARVILTVRDAGG